jgi:hypothetical protein
MTALLGWIIIAAMLCLASMLALWLVLVLARRFYPPARGRRAVFALATVGCCVALWYLIPPIVSWLFGHHLP